MSSIVKLSQGAVILLSGGLFSLSPTTARAQCTPDEATSAAAASVAETMLRSAVAVIRAEPEGPIDFSSIVAQPVDGYEFVTSGGRPLAYVRNVLPNDGNWREIEGTGYFENGLIAKRYQAEAVTCLRPTGGGCAACYRKSALFDQRSLLRYAIFFNGDMEMHPGTTTTIEGPIHANGNLWITSGGGISILGKVTASGVIRSYNDFTNLNLNAHSGNPGYQYPLEDRNAYGPIMISDGNGTPQNMVLPAGGDPRDTNNNRFVDGLDVGWTSSSAALWQDRVLDVSHGQQAVSFASEPYDDYFERTTSWHDTMERHADIKIIGSPGNTNSILIQVATTRTAYGVTSYTEIANIEDGQTSESAIWSIGEFYDGQQQTVVRTIDVDMQNVRARLGGSVADGYGLMYVSTTPRPGDTFTVPTTWNFVGRANYMPAIRILNGWKLPQNSQKAFTFATDRPLYITGDYNTSAPLTSAMLAGDSITVCSKLLTLYYVDGSGNTVPGNTREPANPSAGPEYTPTAAAQSVSTNATLYFGITPSTFVNGKRVTQSGGATNAVRYLENWTGRTHTINGSLLCLFPSNYAKLSWRNDFGHVYYNPPVRVFHWDASQMTTERPGMIRYLMRDVFGIHTPTTQQYAAENLPPI